MDSKADKDGHPIEPTVSGIEYVDPKAAGVISDRQQEHDLSLQHVFKHHPAIIWWSFFWSMAAVGWGFDAQVNGAMISVESFRRDFGYVENGIAILPADWQAGFNVISAAGGIIGGFTCSWVSDKVGRKNALALGLLVMTGGIFAEMFAPTREVFLIAKLILGAGLSFMLTLAPLMTSEISPVVMRGLTTAGVNLGVAIGQLLSNAVVRAFGERTDAWAYRGGFATQFFFVLFLLVGLPFSPESPWYLARNGKLEAAKKSLVKLYGSNIDVDAKLAGVLETIAEEDSASGQKATFAQCFRGTDLIRSIISMGVFVCQHGAGIIFVLGYSTYFFQLAGLPLTRSFDLGVGVTACGVAGNICSWFVVNSFGRRKVFLTGMVALTTLLMLIGIMDVIPTSGAGWVQAACTVIYAFVYFGTIGSMAYVILGETSSTALRAKTMALATATQSVMGVAMSFAIPYMVNPDEGNLRGKVGFVFGGLSLLASIWSWFYIPELKGRRYDEIDRMFQMKVKPRKMGQHML